MKWSTPIKSVVALCLFIGCIGQGVAACEGTNSTIPLDYTLDMSQSGWVKIGAKQHKYPPTKCASAENGIIYAYSPDQTQVDSPVGLVIKDRDTPYLHYKLVRPNGDAYAKSGHNTAIDGPLDEYVNIEYYIDYSTPNIQGGKQSSTSMIGGVYAETGELNGYLHALFPAVNIRATTCTLGPANQLSYQFKPINSSSFVTTEPTGRRRNVQIQYICPGLTTPPSYIIQGELLDAGSIGVLKNTASDGAKGVTFKIWRRDLGGNDFDIKFGQKYEMSPTLSEGSFFILLAANYWKYDERVKAGGIKSTISFELTYN